MPVGRTNRRAFIAALGSAAAWPLVAHAQQQTDKVWRVGYLSLSSASNLSVAYLDGFRLKLNDLGYVEGRNLGLYGRRANDDLAQLPGLASELVSLAPDVIVGAATDATLALQRATSSIPIVMTTSTDPVGGC
jgi:putative ABC transport system substrate-binding protein